jgi:hypothetical protein
MPSKTRPSTMMSLAPGTVSSISTAQEAGLSRVSSPVPGSTRLGEPCGRLAISGRSAIAC